MNFVGVLRAVAIFSLMLALGCATSRMKNIKTLYEQEDYQQVVDSDMECEDFSESCLELNYFKASSYFHLDRYEKAWFYSTKAIDIYQPDMGLSSLDRILLLRVELVWKLYPDLNEWENRTSLLRRLESDLQQGIRRNLERGKNGNNSENVNQLLISLADVLLEKMELYSDKNLDIHYERLKETVDLFGDELKEAGLDEYYLLEGRLRELMPRISSWTYSGQPLSGRDELLTELKALYKNALNLRNLPVYDGTYQGRIEKLIGRIDRYMKDMIL